MSQVRNRKYGWKPDLPDARDHLYMAPEPIMQSLPAVVDLRPQCPPVLDQKNLGSCTSNAISSAIQFERMKQNLQPNYVPSRLFIYYNERVIEGSVGYDAGAQLRDGIQVVSSEGDCPETEWPYDISQFTVKPPVNCYTDALKDRAVSYSRLDNTNLGQLQGCLAQGCPFVFGFTVYESFETVSVANTGMAPMPSPTESALGGHAVLSVGYDNSKQVFIVRNSWGPNWGDNGYFYLPFAYITNENLANDFWTIRIVSNQ